MSETLQLEIDHLRRLLAEEKAKTEALEATLAKIREHVAQGMEKFLVGGLR